jgi:DNA ligase-1
MDKPINMIAQEHIEGLSRLAAFTSLMAGSSSSLKKKQILLDHSRDAFIIKAMEYTYNPYKKFGVHKKTADKNPSLSIDLYSDLWGMLDDLNERRITGHDAIAAVNGFTAQLGSAESDQVFAILDGDLKMRASGTLINDVIPGTIPTFSVALAQSYEPKHADFDSETWYGSRKLDGVRCACRKEGNSVTFYSRAGHEFTTLGRVADEVRKIPGNFVLDGEVCLVDDKGTEDFQGVMKQIKKKDFTMPNPAYLLFDMLSLDEFDSEGLRCEAVLSSRLSRIDEALGTPGIDSRILRKVNQVVMNDETFGELTGQAASLGWEGIMIRRDVTYVGKRSRDLLKVKKFYDDEYVVLEAHMGPIRWVEGGKDVERDCLSYVVIEHKGYRVRVGSGFSKEQRDEYYRNPAGIIGKTVCIKYFEETHNQLGGISLRFPTIKHIYEGSRDV